MRKLDESGVASGRDPSPGRKVGQGTREALGLDERFE
jgi:hypothetical protein